MKKNVLCVMLSMLMLMPVFTAAAYIDETQNKQISELQSQLKNLQSNAAKIDAVLKSIKNIESVLSGREVSPVTVTAVEAAKPAEQAAAPQPAAAAVTPEKAANEPLKPEVKFNGLVFSRYTYALKGSRQDASSTSAFSIARCFIGVTVKNGDEYEANVIVDIPNSSGTENGVDFGAWLRSCYVDIIKLMPIKGLRLRLGQQKTYFGAVDTWPYPLVELPAENRYSIVDSADMGAALLGQLPAGIGEFEVAIYNGSWYKKMETNAEKSYVASIKIYPLFFESVNNLYTRFSYYRNITSAFGAPAKNYYAFSFLTGVKTDLITGHFQYFLRQDDAAAISGKSGYSQGLLAYAGAKVYGPFSVHARFDFWNPDGRAQNDETCLYACGINYDLTKELILQLNYQVTQPRPGQPGKENKFLFQTKWNW